MIMRKALHWLGRETLVIAIVLAAGLLYLAWDTHCFADRPSWLDAWHAAKLEANLNEP